MELENIHPVMTSDPSSSPEGSKPLPKATVPVELAPPAEPVGIAPPSEPLVEAATQGPEVEAAPIESASPATKPAAPTAQSPGFAGWLRSLSMVEKLCCGAIVVGVLVFAALVFLPALNDFPEQPDFAEASDFPIQGSLATVSAAETYWREPVREGPDADSARDVAVLVPVFEAKLKGKGDVRLLFRDAEGEVAGDLLSLNLSGEADYVAAGTVGLMQRGDFTAYQAGEIEPWIVEFHEVPEGAEGISDETELFKMQISPVLK